MSLEKAIASGKEHRKPYYNRAKSVDKTCRSHGSCPWCIGNRMHKVKSHEPVIEIDDLEIKKATVSDSQSIT